MSDVLYDSAKTRIESAVAHAYPLGTASANMALNDRGQVIYPYLVWSITQDEPTTYTLEARHGTQFHRITWQAFGRTLASARDLDGDVADALLDQRLTAAGYDCGPCSTERGGILGRVARDPDDSGVVGITSSLTFAATKE